MVHRNIAMAISIFLLFFCVSFIKCYDKDSFEFNPFETDDISPLYDTIIFNDIVDILSDMEPRGYLPPDNVIKSESESEENIDDLLTEYQHFMENKAHRQLVNHIKKSKSKIKPQVPIIRSDNYINAKPVITLGRDRLYEYLPLPSRIVPSRKFLDILLSQAVPKPYRLPEETDVFRGDILLEDILKAPSPLQQISETALLLEKITNQSNCACRGQPKCECDCVFCKFPLPMPPKYPTPTKKPAVQDEKKPSQLMLQLLGNGPESADKTHDENTISIKINLDIQLPRQQDKLNNQNFSNSKNMQPIGKTIDHSMNLPFPLFPIPIDIYSLNKMKTSRMRTPPSRIHNKKRKATIKSNNKKHKRKFLTFHNINLDAQPPIQPIFQEIHEKMSDIRVLPGTPEKNYTNISAEDIHVNLTESLNEQGTAVPTVSNNSQSNEAFPNTAENTTDDIKYENNIEATEGQPKTHDDVKPSLREKRELRNTINKPSNLAKPMYTIPKRIEKSILTDTELLYWPYNPSSTRFRISANNITNIIKTWNKDDVWIEDKPEAMFTRVNWTDINVAAKTFLFIAGKYARGALTFCSDTMCHSIKCAEAVCTYRTCAPDERWKLKGHCTVASKRNDNVAQLQAMKDVRTDIIFQLVDTLQEKLIGRLVGKITLCVADSCKTFMSMKKMFGKGKCPFTDLTTTGHCSSIKILKLDA